MKTNNAEHTPGPYTLANVKYSDNTSVYVNHAKPGDKLFCDCFGSHARANAEFITRACTAHDELVKMLKLARSMLVARGNMQVGDLDEIEQALTEAEGSKAPSTTLPTT